MVTGDQTFLFHVIGDVREFWMVIGESVCVGDIRGEGYFLVIIIKF